MVVVLLRDIVFWITAVLLVYTLCVCLYGQVLKTRGELLYKKYDKQLKYVRALMFVSAILLGFMVGYIATGLRYGMPYNAFMTSEYSACLVLSLIGLIAGIIMNYIMVNTISALITENAAEEDEEVEQSEEVEKRSINEEDSRVFEFNQQKVVELSNPRHIGRVVYNNRGAGIKHLRLRRVYGKNRAENCISARV